MLKNLGLLLPLVLWGGLLGCDQSIENSMESVEGYGIIGGEIAEADASTVSVLFKVKDKPINICSGTLVAEDIILTAAHCVPQAPLEDIEHFVVGFISKMKDPFGDENINGRGKVIGFRVDPQYGEQSGEKNTPYDLALLRIAGPAPEEFKAQNLPDSNFIIEPEHQLEMLGYGRFDERRAVDGYLRKVIVPATQLTESVQFRGVELVGPGVLALLQPEKGICGGDSGGPLFAISDKGERTLVGVSSGGNNFQNIFKKCHGFSLFVDVRAKIDWIQQAIEELSRISEK